LDEVILKPLGVHRSDTWLCDRVPHSCVNPDQRKAIDRSYTSLIEKYHLPTPSIPAIPKALADAARRQSILDEIRTSQAEIRVMLGDEPIRWFLRYFQPRWQRLRDFERYAVFMKRISLVSR
jgi:hypothetical protein